MVSGTKGVLFNPGTTKILLLRKPQIQEFSQDHIHTVVKMLALTQTKELNATGLERIRGGSPREGFLTLPP